MCQLAGECDYPVMLFGSGPYHFFEVHGIGKILDYVYLFLGSIGQGSHDEAGIIKKIIQ